MSPIVLPLIVAEAPPSIRTPQRSESHPADPGPEIVNPSMSVLTPGPVTSTIALDPLIAAGALTTTPLCPAAGLSVRLLSSTTCSVWIPSQISIVSPAAAAVTAVQARRDAGVAGRRADLLGHPDLGCEHPRLGGDGSGDAPAFLPDQVVKNGAIRAVTSAVSITVDCATTK